MADSWGWVKDAFARYQQKERGAIRGCITAGHGAVEGARAKRDALVSRASEISSTASAHTQMTLDRGWDAVWSTTEAFPLPVVGAATTAFMGAVVGWAPKRAFLFALAASCALRKSIVTQHGDQFSAASAYASSECR